MLHINTAQTKIILNFIQITPLDEYIPWIYFNYFFLVLDLR